MTDFLTIKRTKLADTVVPAWPPIPAAKWATSLLRPFATFTINGESRYATRVIDFASEAAALAAHDGLVARLQLISPTEGGAA